MFLIVSLKYYVFVHTFSVQNLKITMNIPLIQLQLITLLNSLIVFQMSVRRPDNYSIDLPRLRSVALPKTECKNFLENNVQN
jgi:hypothetical protein